MREVQEETGLEARHPVLVRTMTFRDMLLICVEVDIDDLPPIAASDIEAASLIPPDLSLTPAEWPARTIIEQHLHRRAAPAPGS